MEPNENAERQRRGSCLAVMLTTMFTAFLLVLLVLATGGWAVHLVWIIAAIGAFGLIHYLLWGRLMLRQTAGEHEEEELRQADEEQREDAETGANGFHRLP